MAGITRHILADAPPQREQWRVTALVLGTDERAPELERRSEQWEERLAEFKEAGEIQSAAPVAPTNLVDPRQAVAANDATLAGVPRDQVLVEAIEPIHVQRLTCSFADRAKSRLTQPTDFVQETRHVRATGEQDVDGAKTAEGRLRAQRVDFSADHDRVGGRRDGLLRAFRPFFHTPMACAARRRALRARCARRSEAVETDLQ